MSYNFQADHQPATTQKQEHSMGSLLFGAFLGGVDALSTVDAALDTTEAIGEYRAYKFEKHQKEAPNAAHALGKKNVLSGSFGPSAGGLDRQETQPKSRYLDYDFRYQRKRSMAFGKAA